MNEKGLSSQPAKKQTETLNDTYELLDSGLGKKLERLGDFVFVRPAAGAVWEPVRPSAEWKNIDAEFIRKSDGEGSWKTYKKMPDEWVTQINQVQMLTRRTDFGHLGIFAEHSRTWAMLRQSLQQHLRTQKNCRVLNLFAYTGGSTIVAAQSGAEVVHVDASKTSVTWAKQNAQLNGLETHPIRYLVEDVRKFVQRELRRESFYDAIILDPPSYGRGTQSEIWKIEDHLVPLLHDLKRLCSKHFCMLLLSAHSQGYSALALKNILRQIFYDKKGNFEADEMWIETKSSSYFLPSGAYCAYFGSHEDLK